MAAGLFGSPQETAGLSQRRVAWLTGMEPNRPGPSHAAQSPPPEDAGPTGGPVAVAAPARTGHRVRVGWRVRRWLPPGSEEARVDPGRRAAAVLAAALVLGAAVAGVGVWRGRPVAEPAPAALPAVSVTPAASTSPTAAAGELVVSVAGQVVRPGLVRLRPGARVSDAVAAAGGPLPGTDLTSVNLARRLTDGEHVVIGPAAPGVAAAPAGDAAGTPGSTGAKVDLNTATLADLDTLPGVGPVTAQRILDWRTRHGRFDTVDQLREIEGIGETRFARLRDLVTV